MFSNIGFSEILLIGIVALVLFGPQKLPEIGRIVGKTLNEFKKGARELLEEVKTEPPAHRSSNLTQKPTETEQAETAKEFPLTSNQALEQPGIDEASQVNDSASIASEVEPDAAPPRSAARRLPD